MFTRRLLNVSLRATRSTLGTTSSLCSSKTTFLVPNVVNPVIFRTMAVRRGANSRPVKVKEEEEQQSNANTSMTTQSQQNSSVNSQEQQQQSQYNQSQEYYQQQYQGVSAEQVINSSVSLQAFLKRSMVTTGVGIGGAAVASFAFMQLPFVAAHPYITMGVGVVGAIGSLVGMSYNQPTYVQEGEIVKAVNIPARQALFGTFIVAEGLSIAPMLKMAAIIAPIAIPIAGGLAAATMAGMAAYALKQPQGSLAKWGPALYVGVFGLIGVGLVNMFLQSSILMMASSFLGIGVFAAFTAWDTHQAIDAHNAGQPDHLLTAANFFLNFINLFMNYLRLILAFFNSD